MDSNQSTIRVILIDDHPWIHEMVTTALQEVSDIVLVGQGHNGAEAVRLFEYYTPDIVLMDIVMPEMDGIEATAHLLEKFPHAKVLALSSFQDERSIYGMLKNGAVGYLLKTDLSDELATTIRTIQGGNTVLSPQVTQIIMETSTTKSDNVQFGLTDRELEVLQLLAEGLTNGQVAEKLHISTPTVRFHLNNIVEKMGVATRTEALVIAAKNNLV